MKDKPILKTIKIVKLDSETNEPIKNKFEFAIFEDPECTKLIKKIEANVDDGFVCFDELRFGTIYLKEIKAPKNYLLSEKVIKIDINDKGVYADDQLLEESDSIYMINFTNEKEPVIKTGTNISYETILLVAIISLLGMAIGIKRLINKK